jgi:hypothetical protein
MGIPFYDINAPPDKEKTESTSKTSHTFSSSTLTRRKTILRPLTLTHLFVYTVKANLRHKCTLFDIFRDICPQ